MEKRCKQQSPNVLICPIVSSYHYRGWRIVRVPFISLKDQATLFSNILLS